MKKIISVILVVMMAFTAMPAFANATSLEFLDVTYKDMADSVSEGKLVFSLNQPIKCLEAVERALNESDELDSFDVKAFVEGLFGSEFAYSAKMKVDSEEKISMEMIMQTGVPVVINKNFYIDANANVELWMDIDPEIGIDYIMGLPTGSKYLLMNTSEIADDETTEIFKQILEMFTDEWISELNKNNISSLKSNAVITGNNKKVKLTFTDTGIKKYIADVFDFSKTMTQDESAEVYDEELMEQIKRFAEIPMFANEAVVDEYTLDSKGRIIAQNSVVNFDFNFFDFLKAADVDISEYNYEDGRISFTMSSECNIKYQNVEIQKPELTAENSINLADMMAAEYVPGEYPEEEYEYFYRWPSVSVDYMFMNSGDAYYVPLRTLLEEFGYTVEYENGIITATYDGEFTEFTSIGFVTGSGVVTTNSGSIQLGSPLVNVDGRTYIRMLDAEILLNSRAVNYTNLFGYNQYVDFERLTEFDGEY